MFERGQDAPACSIGAGSAAHPRFAAAVAYGEPETFDPADLAIRAVESLDQVLRQMARVEPVRAWCWVSMELLAAGLEIDRGRHVWLVESVNRDARRGLPVMTSIWWTRLDVVRITVEMSNG